MVDLRPFKRTSGLPITNDSATYDELLGKSKGLSAQQQATPKRGLFSSLLAAVTPSTTSTPATIATSSLQSLSTTAEITDAGANLSETLHETTPITETVFLETEHIFPVASCASGGSPQLFEWIVPSAARVHESNLPVSEEGPTDSQLDALTPSGTDVSAGDNASPITDASSPITEQDGIELSDTIHTTDIHEVRDGTLQTIMEEVVGAEIEFAIDTSSHPSSDLSSTKELESPQSAVLSTETVSTGTVDTPYRENLFFSPLPWEGDTDGVEVAFGRVFGELSTLSASNTVQTDHLFVRSTIDTEQIALQFALAFDEMEGKLLGASQGTSVSSPVSSEERQIHSDVLDSALHDVETFIEKADTPAPLREFIEESLADASHLRSKDSENPHTYVGRRLISLSLDLALVALLSLVVTAFFERGGLAALLADISIDGLKAHHSTWFLVSLCCAPCLYSVYTLLGYICFDATLGQRLLGLGVRVQNGRPLKGRHMVVRSLAAPLALVVGGSLPVLLGRRPLIDTLSATETY